MSVCPGCGRCRECGQRTAPAPVYPWYGPHLQPGQPIWIAPYPTTTTSRPMFTWTTGANTGSAL